MLIKKKKDLATINVVSGRHFQKISSSLFTAIRHAYFIIVSCYLSCICPGSLGPTGQRLSIYRSPNKIVIAQYAASPEYFGIGFFGV